MAPAADAGAREPLQDAWFSDLVGFNQVNLQGSRLTLWYDASRLRLDQLLQRLHLHGYYCASTAMTRFRVGWYNYTDRNIAANANDTSTTACSQSPLRHR